MAAATATNSPFPLHMRPSGNTGVSSRPVPDAMAERDGPTVDCPRRDVGRHRLGEHRALDKASTAGVTGSQGRPRLADRPFNPLDHQSLATAPYRAAAGPPTSTLMVPTPHWRSTGRLAPKASNPGNAVTTRLPQTRTRRSGRETSCTRSGFGDASIGEVSPPRAPPSAAAQKGQHANRASRSGATILSSSFRGLRAVRGTCLPRYSCRWSASSSLSRSAPAT
jgi:hypothetical protein